MKTGWIDHFCPQSGVAGFVENLHVEAGYLFEYKFRMSEISDIERTCYPHLYASFEGPANEDDVLTELALIPTELAFTMLVGEPDEVGEGLKINGSIVSDAYTMDESLTDTQF